MSDLGKTLKEWAASAGLIDPDSNESSGQQAVKAAPAPTRRANDVSRSGVPTYQAGGAGGAAKRVGDMIAKHKKDLDDL